MKQRPFIDKVQEPENGSIRVQKDAKFRWNCRRSKANGTDYDDYFIGYRVVSGELISVDVPESYDELTKRTDRAMWMAGEHGLTNFKPSEGSEASEIIMGVSTE